MISISLIPNFDEEEIKICTNGLLGRFEKNGGYVERFEKMFGEYMGVKNVYLCDSGRTGIGLVLSSLGLKRGDEVLIQAMTCSVVSSAIMSVGAKPVYVDVDEKANMDLNDLLKKITKKTGAIIAQHSFGRPDEIDTIKNLCESRGLVLIEDCAHGLGNSYEGKKLGRWGDMAVFSFGRDKVISGVWGGAVILNSEKFRSDFEERYKKLDEVYDKKWVEKQLGYVFTVAFLKKIYDFGVVGKLVHKILRLSGFLEGPISDREKRGKIRQGKRGMPEAFCRLCLRQLEKLDGMIIRRKEISRRYAEELGLYFDERSSYLRFNIFVDDGDKLRREAARENIFLGDWYDAPVAPKSVNPRVFGYKWGSCPRAEKMCKRIANLPTNPNLSNEEVESVIKFIKHMSLRA